MKTLTFITGNEHKLAEAQGIFDDVTIVGKDIDLPEIQSLNAREVVEHKALRAYEAHGEPCFVEDVSVTFEALGDLPGPFIKHFMDTLGSKGVADLVHKYDNHRAINLCTIGYVDESGDAYFFEGRNDGTIVAPRGESGFGFDPIFIPDGYEQTYAQMPIQTKNSLSHRRMALTAMMEHIKNA